MEFVNIFIIRSLLVAGNLALAFFPYLFSPFPKLLKLEQNELFGERQFLRRQRGAWDWG